MLKIIAYSRAKKIFRKFFKKVQRFRIPNCLISESALKQKILTKYKKEVEYAFKVTQYMPKASKIRLMKTAVRETRRTIKSNIN